MTLQEAIIQLLLSKKLITPDLAVSKSLREAVLRLSDLFTRDRSELPTNYFDEEINRLAYIASFVLTNSAKVAVCLEQVVDSLPAHGPLSILDIGTGPGTAVFAASSLFSDRSVFFTAVEKTPAILSEAKRLEFVLPDKHSVEWISGDAREIPDKRFDITIAANIINELDAGEQLKTCKELLSRSKFLVIIDPALRQTARSLMKLRDALLGDSPACVIAPCTHQKPCPMLLSDSPSPPPLSRQGRGPNDAPQRSAGRRSSRDWCHFYLEWNRPKLIEALDRATGLDHRYLKMAYLVLRTTNHESRSTNLWRVVSSPLKSKGKLELVVCGNGKLKRIRRLDKNASETNVAFGNAKRGDLVNFSSTGLEVRKEDVFAIGKGE